jgi:PIN domain nuclease of toxin-antitoxin system
MKLLLDTHSFLWFIGGSSRLSRNARMLIEDVSNQSVLSLASIWEIAIKVSIGKLSLGQTFETFIPQQMSLNGIGLLEISFPHTAVVATLPFHHRDPFDRLLIAQAIVEQIPIVSCDTALDRYAITRLW